LIPRSAATCRIVASGRDWYSATASVGIGIGIGIGHDLTVTGFGSVTTSRLRVALTGRIATEQYTPTLTEIAVYRST
jgi:hypothetical protein